MKGRVCLVIFVKWCVVGFLVSGIGCGDVLNFIIFVVDVDVFEVVLSDIDIVDLFDVLVDVMLDMVLFDFDGEFIKELLKSEGNFCDFCIEDDDCVDGVC